MNIFLSAGLGIVFSILCVHSLSAETIVSGRLGTVTYVLPQGKASDVTVLFTDPTKPEETKPAVQRLTALGTAVAIIDTPSYLTALSADKGDCVYLSSDIEMLSHAIQRQLNFQDFRLPVLASLGGGGALVYVLLAEAPSYSFAGGASVDFTPAAPAKLNFCGGPTIDKEKNTLRPQDVHVQWEIEAAPSASDTVQTWLDGIDKAELKPMDAKQTSPERLAALVNPILTAAISKDPNSLEDLPLIEMPASTPQPYVAIILSGDGGWRDLDRTLGQALAGNGIPVVGLDSFLYFWQPKRPEVVAHDLDRILNHYAEAWKPQKFVLIGYSFGADILPFVYNRLSDENKAKIAEISLLGLSRNTNFEISFEAYFSDEATEKTRPVEPELIKLPKAQVQCFYGVDEAADSACTTDAAKGMEIVETPGGHHFGDDYDTLAKEIMAGAKKRLSANH